MFTNRTRTPVDIAIDRMLELDRHYDLKLWPPDALADRRHDITVMWQQSDLACLATEVHSRDGLVLFDYRICFDSTNLPHGNGKADWPLLDMTQVAGGRVLVVRHSKEPAYRHLLRLNWSPATALAREPHRHRLVVTQSGPLFAFAKLAHQPACDTHVFLLRKFAEAGLNFHAGQRLTAEVVVTPKGLQGRDIRAA